MSQTLEGKVALVTGASRGIGRAAAIALAEAGARVAVNHRVAEEEAHDVARAIRVAGGEALAVRADITEPDDIAAMIERVRAAFGSVDILVNNAGIARPVPLDEVHLATWDATLAVNLTAPFLVSSADASRRCATRSGGGSSSSRPRPRASAASSARTTPRPRPVSKA